MKTASYFPIILILTLFFLSGCKKNDQEVVPPVYLIDFTEYVPTSNPLTANDIKGYVEGYGLTEVASLVKYDIKIYKINYKTVFEGDSIIASGLIAVPVPKDKSNAFPMLSYQHGTITSDSESPTNNPLSKKTAIALYMASTGFVVMIPDYIGFGSSSDKFHPFMIKKYTVSSILDFIRVSKEFIASERPCKINGKLFLSGYSEGGSATLEALSAIENDAFNSDLSVTASVCGAGLYDLNAFRSWMVSQPKYDQPYFIAYLLKSFKQYSGLVLNDTLVFSAKFASIIPGMIDGVRTGDEMNAMFATLDVGELFNDKFEEPDTLFKYNSDYNGLRTIFSENSVPAWNLKSDVTLFYGKDDMWVPGEQSLKIYQEFRKQGATLKITLDPLDGLDNTSAEIPTLTNSIIWFKKF
jgi:dienelactone hydrolase